ncbi:MAG: DUF2723 domain-containing protein [Chloroflexi bacterium]|nr:DUF2723 domain-containing protein [Chloroflexota bacterium]
MSRRVDRWLAAGCGLSAGILYLRTLAPGLLFGDPAEFQVAAWIAGLAHPTGYPLYLLLGWLWSHLLVLGTPPWRMNLLSAAWGGTAVGIGYLVALGMISRVSPRLPLSARRLAAASATLAFAANPTFWSQAVIAEVYTLHALLLACALWLIVREDEGQRAPVLLAWVVGLGLAHHRTTILWLPGLLAWAWLKRPAVDRGTVGRMLAGLILPQLLYLYIPLRAPATPYLWVPLGPGETLPLYDRSLDGFLAFVTGRVFAGELLTPAAAWGQIPAALSLISQNLSEIGLALAIIGLAWMIERRSWDLLAPTGLMLLAQVGFNLFYGIGDVYVLYVPVYLIAALWAGVGLSALATLAIRWRRALALAIAAAGLLLPIFLMVTFFPRVDRSADREARTFWENILSEPLPQQAILVSNDRDEMVPLIYLQQVEHRRPDLTGLFPLMVMRPGWLNVGQVTASALDTGRPVFLVKPMPGLDVRFDLRPVGAVVQVEGSVTRPPGEPLGVVGDALILLAVATDTPDPQPGQPLELTLYWEPKRSLERDYTSFVHLLAGNGEKIGQHDAPPGGMYYPTSLWQPGEVLRDRHSIPLPDTLPPGPYSLRIGLYAGPDLVPLGDPLVLPWSAVTIDHRLVRSSGSSMASSRARICSQCVPAQ